MEMAPVLAVVPVADLVQAKVAEPVVERSAQA
jgi:hypothetical protein